MNTILKYWLVVVLITPLLFISASKPSGVKFHKGTLSSAKELAARDGKLYMVDFVASWCMPCRWMEETTFSNPEVMKYLDEHYISVKIDIDDFDGFAYKQIYGIKILPSILLFNSKGELLVQYQESLAPSKMLKILHEYNTPSNRVAFASTPQQYQQSGNTASGVKPTHRPAKKEDAAPVSAPAKPKVNKPQVAKPQVSKPKLKPVVKPALKPSKPTVAAPAKPKRKWKPAAKPNTTTFADEGLYRFKVSRQASKGFSVQIGAYKEYGNVLREVAGLEDRFNEPIIVHISRRQNLPVYKVMLGEFIDRAQADQFKSYIQQNGLEAMIKDMSQL